MSSIVIASAWSRPPCERSLLPIARIMFWTSSASAGFPETLPVSSSTIHAPRYFPPRLRQHQILCAEYMLWPVDTDAPPFKQRSIHLVRLYGRL
ncbi:hypothetical protein PsYK624_138980 [Phanerochaete sordida]|uniref:Uncharacterized protein n=1 Tax=Phanerochaete sordida TaxID=48140 RepID=A0A9P3LKW5_9APHY|nr:hypothetical protein PsYK624_138980 [Phanerochaete sordida]